MSNTPTRRMLLTVDTLEDLEALVLLFGIYPSRN